MAKTPAQWAKIIKEQNAVLAKGGDTDKKLEQDVKEGGKVRKELADLLKLLEKEPD